MDVCNAMRNVERNEMLTFAIVINLAQNPSCPKAMMQFQHGTYVLPDNGSIVLTPFAVDGRQLWSDPCANAKNAVYTRYNQSELYRVRHKILFCLFRSRSYPRTHIIYTIINNWLIYRDTKSRLINTDHNGVSTYTNSTAHLYLPCTRLYFLSP